LLFLLSVSFCSANSFVDLSEYPNVIPLIPGLLTLYAKKVTEEDTTISLALQAPSTGAMSVGWSPGGTMGGADAVFGWTNGDNAPNIANYTLPAHRRPTGTIDLGLEDFFGMEYNGTSTLFFTRQLNSGNFHITPAGNRLIGAVFPGKALTFHRALTPLTTAIVVDFFTGTTNATSSLTLVNIHGFLMFTSWGVLLPFGMLWARYARNWKGDIWFQVHRAVQYFGFTISVVGFILIFIGSPDKYGIYFHHIFGTIIMSAGLLQVLSAFFRPHKKEGYQISRSRVIFEYFHWWNGRIVLLAAIYQVYSGILLEFQHSDYVQILSTTYIILAGIVILVVVIVEIVSCLKGQENKPNFVPCWKCYEQYELE